MKTSFKAIKLARAVTPFLLLFATGGAFADCGGTQPNVSCIDTQVTELYLQASGSAYVKVNGNMGALPCSLDGGYITLKGTETNFKAAYATLLSAQSQSRLVSIRMTADPICTVSYIIAK